ISRVPRHIYADVRRNSGGHNQRKDQWIGKSIGLRCRHRPCGDGDHPVHRTHIRCSSEPRCHHSICHHITSSYILSWEV
ncbi:hypothetical protein S245_007286, partial [Arachis hypogaea]